MSLLSSFDATADRCGPGLQGWWYRPRQNLWVRQTCKAVKKIFLGFSGAPIKDLMIQRKYTLLFRKPSRGSERLRQDRMLFLILSKSLLASQFLFREKAKNQFDSLLAHCTVKGCPQWWFWFLLFSYYSFRKFLPIQRKQLLIWKNLIFIIWGLNSGNVNIELALAVMFTALAVCVFWECTRWRLYLLSLRVFVPAPEIPETYFLSVSGSPFCDCVVN